MSHPSPWSRAALLVALVVIAYLPVWRAGFIWDDAQYITESEPLRTWAGLGQIWFQPGATEQYYPLTETTFFAEYRLWGDRPLGYHLDNVLLFAATALVLWRLLLRLGVPGAWLAAALFALHPVQVESVAWVTERKNMLSGLLFLGSLYFAVRYWRLDETDAEAGPREGKFYAASLALYVAALLAKTAVVPLPAVVALLIWWKRPARLASEAGRLAPFFAAGLLMGLATLYVEKHFVGTTAALYTLDFPQRLILIGKALVFYLFKLALPWPLIFVYPRWTLDPAQPLAWLPLAAVVMSLAALWRVRATRWKPVFLAAAYFVLMLAPACGTFNQYFFRYSFVADHLQYLASIGPLTLAAAALATLAKRARVVNAVAAALLVALGALTTVQCLGYRDVETLWRTVLARNPDSDLAQYDLGNVLLKRGDLTEAIIHYRKAIALNPRLPEAHCNLGTALAQEGHEREALTEYEAALAIDPDNRQARYNIEVMQNRLNAAGDVIAPVSHVERGARLEAQGDRDGAIAEFARAVQVDPGDARAHWRLGSALSKKGSLNEALAELQKARALDPGNAEVRNDLGITLAQKGRLDDAIAEFQEAVRLKPDYAAARENLAKAEALGGRGN